VKAPFGNVKITGVGAGLVLALVAGSDLRAAAQAKPKAPKAAAPAAPTPAPTPTPEPTPADRVTLRVDEAAKRVEVKIDGQLFTAYIWPDVLTKPVLYPILTEKGAFVTRGYPLDPRPGERTDHPHHVGLWFSYGSVNGIDFWNNSTALPPEEQAKMGRTRQMKVLEAAGGPTEGRLRVAVEWVMPSTDVVLDEETTFVFRATEIGRVIDRTTRLTARGVQVAMLDNKEGLLGMRVNRALEHPSREAATFTDAEGRPSEVPVLDNSAVTGLYRSSEGKEGDEVWGTRGRWVTLSGNVGSESVTIAMFDHPKNPGYPTYWHARGYGLFAANPLGQKELSKGKDELKFKIEARTTATFRYEVVVTSKGFSMPVIENLWKEFSKQE
jgi:hypothetical protein